jgi:Xaa-Pro aminopeptidase
MKSDLDRLMAERNLDGFLVLGDSGGNAALNYLTGGAPFERALLVKRRGGPATLIHGGMERDDAVRTGLELVDRDARYDMMEYLQRAEGDRLGAQVAYLADVFRDQGLRGRIGIYGKTDAGEALTLLNTLHDRLEETELVGEYGVSLFTEARETKDDAEVARMAEAGRLTSRVVGEVQEFIQGHRMRGELVVQTSGAPLTIGDVKAFLRGRLQHHGLREDHETIFAQGRDAGVPHNRGTPDMPLQLGQAIVFDIFPQVEGGYFHDMTRTWSLGYATEEVWAAWEQVKEIFDRTMAAAAVGLPCRDLQLMTLDFFEGKGHPTARSQPGGHEGYVHSLGHGVGLDIHEGPALSIAAGNTTLLQPGHAVSIEPGLYYPARGFGVRVEDTIAFRSDGTLVNLTDYPYDLVVPMRG